jgi:hypothetical protein
MTAPMMDQRTPTPATIIPFVLRCKRPKVWIAIFGAFVSDRCVLSLCWPSNDAAQAAGGDPC